MPGTLSLAWRIERVVEHLSVVPLTCSTMDDVRADVANAAVGLRCLP